MTATVEAGCSNNPDASGEPRFGGPDASPYAEPPPGWSNNPPGTVSPPESDFEFKPPGWSNTGPAATGATAGTPGTWTPAGSLPADDFTQMDSVTASPVTAWTTGQYVVLGDWSHAHWGGANWTSGEAP
jgi:hypothetical protein